MRQAETIVSPQAEDLVSVVSELELDPDQKLAEVLSVKPENDIVQKIPEREPEERKETEDYRPSNNVTRKKLITKVREIMRVSGKDEAEIKDLNLHRRRKNSLKRLLRSELDCAMNRDLEKKIGLPADPAKREEWVLNTLYRLDLTFCKMLEKGVDFLGSPVVIDGFSEEIENTPGLQEEIKGAFAEFLRDPDNEWIKEYSSPGIRLVMAHAYAGLSVARRRPRHQQPSFRRLPSHAQAGIIQAKLKKTFSPYPKNEIKDTPEEPIVRTV